MNGRLDVDGGVIAYEVEGDGPLVICVPGMGDLRGQYRILAPRLVEAGYRVATVDLRGHGDSSVGFPRYGPCEVGDDLLALGAHLGGGPAVCVVNSAAAASSIWAAAQAPEQVSALVMVGPVARDAQAMPEVLRQLISWLVVLPFWGRWIWTMFYRSLYKGGLPEGHEAHVATVSRNASTSARRRALWDVGTRSKAVCSARVSEVGCPVLAILGDQDPDYPDVQAEADWLREALAAEVVVRPGVGHYPHLEEGEDTAGRVVDFLRRTAATASEA